MRVVIAKKSKLEMCHLNKFPGRSSAIVIIIAWLLTMPIAADAATTTIVAFGASNTFGKGVKRGEAYPAHLEKLLRAKGLDIKVINAGISGNATGQMLKRIKSDVPSNTDIVIFQPGRNDLRKGGTLKSLKTNIKKINKRLKRRNINVIRLKNSHLKQIAKNYPRPDGQHFLSPGYKALARLIMPDVLALIGK